MKYEELKSVVKHKVDQQRRVLAQIASPLFSQATAAAEDPTEPVGPGFASLMMDNLEMAIKAGWHEKYLLEVYAILDNPLVPQKKARLVSLVHFWQRSTALEGRRRKLTGQLALKTLLENELRTLATGEVADWLESILLDLDDDEPT